MHSTTFIKIIFVTLIALITSQSVLADHTIGNYAFPEKTKRIKEN